MNTPVYNFTLYFDGIIVIKLEDGNFYPVNISISDLLMLFENEGYSFEVIREIAKKRGGFTFTKTPIFRDLFIDDSEDLFYTPSFFTTNEFLAVHLELPVNYEIVFIDIKRKPLMKKNLLIKNEKDFLKYIYTHKLPKQISFPENFKSTGLQNLYNFCRSWTFTVSYNQDKPQPEFVFH